MEVGGVGGGECYSTCNLPVSAIYNIILSSILKEQEFFQNSPVFQEKIAYFWS